MKTFMDNTKSLSKKKENVQEQPVSDTATNLQQALSSDSSLIPVPFIFIKSDLRLVIDLQTCIKAQQSEAYIQEHGYDTRADFNAALTNAENQTSLARKKMKDTEQQLKNVNEQIHFTGQYLAYKDLYAQYRKSHNRNKFYEEHKAELSLYETALRVLKEKSNGQKLPSMKSLYQEKDRLTELREVQRSDFYSHRDQERELRTVDANIDMILGKKPEQEHHIEKEQNL